MPGRRSVRFQAGLALLASVIAVGAFSIPGASALRRSANRPASAPATSCVSRWYVSTSGLNSWRLLRTDTKGLPLSALVFSPSFNDPSGYSAGYLDFNGDGHSDVFATVKLANGKYQWMYSPSGTGKWVNLAARKTPPANLRFGDFNADGLTDVFFTTARTDGNLQWWYAPGGKSPFVQLAYADTPLRDLRFGDFDGDGKTDVFSIIPKAGGLFQWRTSHGGTASWQNLVFASTKLRDMRFVDIDHDGHTDVFTMVPGSSSGQWQQEYSSAASSPYQTMESINLTLADVRFAGDFDRDFATDMFFTQRRSDGTYQWYYRYYHVSPQSSGYGVLAHDTLPPSQLRFGDFNGDRVTDVFKLARTC